MSKTRMAGEELQKDKNYAARERIYNDSERREEKLGEIDTDQYDLDGFSDKDVIMAFKGGTFDSNDYDRLTGKPGKPDNDTPAPTPEPEPEPEPEVGVPVAPPTNGGGIGEGQGPTQTIMPPGLLPGIPTGGGGINFNQNQDNDQSIVNNGSNNTNTQTADNGNTFSQGGAAGFSKDWMNKYFNFGG